MGVCGDTDPKTRNWACGNCEQRLDDVSAESRDNSDHSKNQSMLFPQRQPHCVGLQATRVVPAEWSVLGEDGDGWLVNVTFNRHVASSLWH